VSPTECYALDHDAQGVLRWDGTTWSTLPVGAPATGRLFLLHVSCASADACLFGGYRQTPADAGQPAGTTPLLLRWDGRSIRDVSSSIRSISGATAIDGLSCVEPSWCLFRLSQSAGIGIWDGTTSVLTPLPPDVQLLGNTLSCGARTNCMTLAQRRVSEPAGAPWPTGALHWDGSSWMFETIPAHGEAHLRTLSAVTCSGPSFCAAGGNVIWTPYLLTATNTLLAEWNPTRRWSPLRNVLPLNSEWSPELGSISCTSPQWCVTFGYRSTLADPGTRHAQVFVWTGAGWFLAPPPPRALMNGAVTCARTERWCLVHGAYDQRDAMALTAEGPS
jgi:hypothetical protein